MLLGILPKVKAMLQPDATSTLQMVVNEPKYEHGGGAEDSGHRRLHSPNPFRFDGGPAAHHGAQVGVETRAHLEGGLEVKAPPGLAEAESLSAASDPGRTGANTANPHSSASARPKTEELDLEAAQERKTQELAMAMGSRSPPKQKNQSGT